MTDSNTHARYTAAEHAAQEAREQAETSNRLLEEAEKAAEVAYASLVTEQKENHMTNNNNNDNDNLIGLNEFIQDISDIELDWGVDEDERPFPDSDEAIRALQDDVEDMEVEIARLRAELKTSNAERDDARREVCELTLPCAGSQRGYAKGRGWDCYTNQETK